MTGFGETSLALILRFIKKRKPSTCIEIKYQDMYNNHHLVAYWRKNYATVNFVNRWEYV